MAYVQGKNIDGSNSLTFNGAVAAGNTLVAVLRVGANAATATVTDSVNGSGGWTCKCQFEATDGHTLIMCYLPNTAAGTPTLTVNPSSSGTNRYAIAEYGGVAAASFDTWATQDNSASSSTLPTPTIATAQASEILIAAMSTANGLAFSSNGSGSNPSSGWTNRAAVATSKLVVDDVVVSSTGSYDEVFSIPSTDHGACGILALKASGGGGGPTIFGSTLPVMGVG